MTLPVKKSQTMNGTSIRTMMLMTLGCAMLINIFTMGASSVAMFHTQLVLAFAIPGGSMGYDRWRTSRGVIVGICLAASLGTLLVSGIILAIGW